MRHLNVPVCAAVALSLVSTAGFAYERGDVLLHLPFDGSVQPDVGSVTVRSGTPAYTNDTPSGLNSSLHVTGAQLQLNIPKTGLLRPDLKNATIEFFIKGIAVSAGSWAVPIRISPNPAAVATPPFPLLVQTDGSDRCGFRVDCFDNIDEAWQSQTTGRQSLTYTTTGKFADQTWHHVALVITENENGSAKVRYYYDYRLAAEKNSTALQWSGLTEAMTLDFGGTSGLDCCVDEFRISYGALSPTEFEVIAEAKTGDTLYYLSFDDETVLSSVRGPERGSLASGTPVYSATDLPGSSIYSGASGARTARSNLKALACDHSQISIKLPLANLLRPVLPAATIEFFMKGSVYTAWDAVVRIYNPSAQYYPPFPLLAQVADTGKLNLRVDCGTDDFSDSTVNQLQTGMGRPFADDRWHHYAVTIEPDGAGHTVVKYYLDHVLKATNTSTDYEWKGISSVHELSFGSNGSKCWIDEFRITKGVLQPDAFLNMEPSLSEVLVYLPFDGDLASSGRAACAPTLLSGTAAYSAKGFRDQVITTFCSDGKPRANNGALHVTGGMTFSFPGEAMRRPNLKNATIEMFIKGDAGSAVTWRHPVKFYNDLANPANPPFPILFEINAGTKLDVRLDAFDDASSATSSASAREVITASNLFPFNDAEWHHVAVSIAVGAGGMSTYKWYLDYRLVKEATTTKFGWSGLTPDMRMYLDGGNGLTYWLDEMRISAAVLEPSQFISKAPSGLTLIVR